MPDSISSIVSTQGVTAPVLAAPALSNAGTQSFSVDSSSPSSTASSAAGSLQNPRTVLDPAAGFITEYFSANGSEVIAQTPNAITVAYLRQGLTADGETKQPTYTPHVATSA